MEEIPSGSLTVDRGAPNGLSSHLSWKTGKGLLILFLLRKIKISLFFFSFS
jgi:hypothetical protein